MDLEERVTFVEREAVLPAVEKVFEEERARIVHVLPRAEVHHIGGTAVPGLLTKGDLDINVRVQKADFPEAVEVLKSMYAINQPENWAEYDYASFKSDTLRVDFGAQLTVIGAPHDFFLRFRDALCARPALVAELNVLKRSYDGALMSEYRAAKGAFVERVLTV